jgi:hypothetical protein
MPYTVPVSFDRFLENISLTGDHAQTAATRPDRIVELLRDTFTIVEAFPTGSLVRGTALKARADVDVMVALHYANHIEGKSPRRVLEDVREHLSEYNAKLVKKNGQAVTLYFQSWPNVDIVPAARVANNGLVSHYEIPDANRQVWIKTNPRKHDAAMRELSTGDRERIRMIKTWNDAHSGYLQSFHVEVLALKVSRVTGDWPWDVFQFFSDAKPLLGGPLLHPTTSDQVDDYLTGSDRREVLERVERAIELARDAWWQVHPPNDNHAEAIRLYRILFGDRFPAYG